MRNFNKVLGKGWIFMSDGEQQFERGVVIAMSGINLWGDMYQCHKLVDGDLEYYISIGGIHNARYFKTDGQQYCVNLHIAKGEDCFLERCYTSFSQNELQDDIFLMKSRIDIFLKDKPDFKTLFEEKCNHNVYRNQTSQCEHCYI